MIHETGVREVLDVKEGDTLSEGTLKSDDLMRAFLLALADSPESQRRIRELWNDPPKGEEEEALFVDDLSDILNDMAPDNLYFGASEGDGACFGFWSIDD